MMPKDTQEVKTRKTGIEKGQNPVDKVETPKTEYSTMSRAERLRQSQRQLQKAIQQNTLEHRHSKAQ